jgi:hypothetical protein
MTWPYRPPLLLIAIAAALAACRGSDDSDGDGRIVGDSTGVGQSTCSAATLRPLAESEGLPPAVAATRRAILEAAVSCDFDRLESLALEGTTAFAYGSEDSLGPAAHWRALEAVGEEPIARLVRILDLPWARETYELEPRVSYLWPSAFRDGATGFDLMALEGHYSGEEIARFIEQGSYTGARAGITEEGDWWFFIAGDPMLGEGESEEE